MDRESTATSIQTVEDRLSVLRERGVKLWVEGDRVCYRAPLGALLAEDLDILREQKSHVLRALSRVRENSASQIRSHSIETCGSSPIPLSSQQRWFWKSVEVSCTWNHFCPVILRMRGVLNVEALRASLEVLIGRHDSLRTRIVLSDGIPYQHFDEPRYEALTLIHVSGTSDEDLEQRARMRVEDFLRTRIDLAIGPLCNKILLRLSETDHVLVIGIHHIVTDAVSMRLFCEELWEKYREFENGRKPTLEPPVLQYAEYVSWQSRYVSTCSETIGSYWNRRLEGAKPVQWPNSEAVHGGELRPAGKSESPFGASLTQQIRSLAGREKVASVAIVIAALCALIARRCEQRDFVIPFIFHGRQSHEHLNTIGFFIHPLLLRIELEGGESLLELVQYVSNEIMQASAHQDFGLCSVARSELTTGVFVQWLTWPAQHMGVPEPSEWESDDSKLCIQSFPVEEQVPPEQRMDTDFVLFLNDHPNSIESLSFYRTDLFTSASARTISDDLQSLCERAVASPKASGFVPIFRVPEG